MLKNYLSQHWDEIAGEMAAVMKECRVPPMAAEMIEYQLQSGGKRVRPVLTMLVEDAYCGAVSKVLPFAAAVELIHNASLIHDDLQDEDEIRRDRPTIWKAFSTPQAINLGDLVFTLAFKLFDRLRAPAEKRFAITQLGLDCVAALVVGQMLEFHFKAAGSYNEPDYLSVAENKTAALFRLVFRGAGELADAEEEELGELDELGRLLGLLFQVRDDVIDVTGFKEGRAAGGDIAEGKITLMAAHFLAGSAPEDRRQEVAGILALPKGETGPDLVTRVAELYFDHGSVAHCVERLGEYENAIRALTVLSRRPRLAAGMEEVLARLRQGVPD